MKLSQLQAKWKQPFYEQIVLLQSWAEKPSASHPTMKNYNLCSKKIRGLLHHGDTTGPNKFWVPFEILCNIISQKGSFDLLVNQICYWFFIIRLKSIHFKNKVARSSVLSKLWSFPIIHQLTLFWFQLMYYWKWS